METAASLPDVGTSDDIVSQRIWLHVGTGNPQVTTGRRGFFQGPSRARLACALDTLCSRSDERELDISWVRSRLNLEPDNAIVCHDKDVVSVAAACWSEASRRLASGEGVSVLSFPEEKEDLLPKIAETMMMSALEALSLVIDVARAG
eukprot:536636-Hanusia_phi.AAC.1